MQIELRTQVIEPQRKTFQHIIDRYGDRPSTRYEEGTIDLQSTVNFHYKPLWAPDKDIYSPDFSVLKLTDPYSFMDPRQFYYAPMSPRAPTCTRPSARRSPTWRSAGSLSGCPRAGPASSRTSSCRCATTRLRQMISAFTARYGWGTSITQCASYASFDRIGNAQILSRMGISFGGGTAEPLALAKTAWLEDDTWQPLRKHVELMLVEQDWGKGLVALDVTDRVIYDLLYTHLDDAAIMSGAGSYSLVAQHLSGWFTDQRKWFDALYKAWVADPEHGPANAATLAAVVETTLGTVADALAPVAAAADGLVAAGTTDALAAAIETVRAAYAGLDITKEN